MVALLRCLSAPEVGLAVLALARKKIDQLQTAIREPERPSLPHPFRGLRRSVLLVLLLTSAVLSVAARHGFELELVQTAAFPVFAVMTFLLFRNSQVRPPTGLFALSLCCWGWGALNIRGHLPDLIDDRIVTLAIPDGGFGENADRQLLRRYNVIAQAYRLPKMTIRLRSFAGTAAAQQWLNGRSETRMLVVPAGEEWLTVVFPANLRLGPPRTQMWETALDASVVARLREQSALYQVDLSERVEVLTQAGLGSPLVLAISPDSIAVPTEPSELTRHYLGWIARGISETPDRLRTPPDAPPPPDPTVAAYEFHQDALSQTLMMLGAWHSPTPLSLGRFFFANVNLLETVTQHGATPLRFATILGEYYSSLKLLRRGYDDELEALVRNNAGVARMLAADTDDQRRAAQREFAIAAAIAGKDGNPVLGARLAMLNLTMLTAGGELGGWDSKPDKG